MLEQKKRPSHEAKEGYKIALNKKIGLCILVYIAIILSVNFTGAAGGLNCTIATSCPVGFAKLLGLENESNGFHNAHTQNNSLGTYTYSLCCDSTTGGINLNNSCSGGTTFLKLSATTNAHVQQPSIDTYPESACISSTPGVPSCDYQQNSCGSSECLLSMAGSEGDNTTNAHVGNCTSYSTLVCCSFNNTAPTQVTLITPINATLITNRTPFFNWTNSSDAEGDSITYRIQVALDSGFSSVIIDQTTNNSNYTQTTELDFDQYFWRVYANDTVNWSVSLTENFTIVTLVNLTLVTVGADFGSLQLSQQNDTDDGSPAPLVLRNDGNVEANVSINATALFSSVGLGTPNYQYKADNQTEPGSFKESNSTMSFANMPNSAIQFLRVFNHTDSNDLAEIDVRILVPGGEPPGQKNSTIQLTGEVS